MSLGNTLTHILGLVAGFLIPGANKDTGAVVAAVQQDLANAMGEAAADLATRLKADTTGMTGPEKVFAIAGAMVSVASTQGFKGDLRILEAVALDVAQAAYRKSIEPEIATGIVAIATALHVTPLVMVGVDLLANYVQAGADKAAGSGEPAVASV